MLITNEVICDCKERKECIQKCVLNIQREISADPMLKGNIQVCPGDSENKEFLKIHP